MQISYKVVDIFWFMSILAKNQTFKGKFTHRKECDRSYRLIHSPPISLLYQVLQSLYNTRGRIVGYQIRLSLVFGLAPQNWGLKIEPRKQPVTSS